MKNNYIDLFTDSHKDGIIVGQIKVNYFKKSADS